MRNRFAALASALFLLVLPAAAQPADSATQVPPRAEQRVAGDGEVPDGFVRARQRQEFRDVVRHGIQATCGTDERPVTCTIVAKRGLKTIDRQSDEIARPYNRVQFHLELSGRTGRRIIRHGPPVKVTVSVKVVDPDGNVSRDSRRIRLVRDD
jgi:hypothetical protein